MSTAPYARNHVAPTPPPLLSAAARGRQQTLGPMFSEEEDGDDSEFIEARMKELGISHVGLGEISRRLSEGQRLIYQVQPSQADVLGMANRQQLLLQQQALQLQQQYLLQQLLTNRPVNRGQPGTQDVRAVQLQQLQLQMQQVQMHTQMQAQAQAQMQTRQYGVDPRVQAQLLAQLQASVKPSAAQQHAEAQAHAFTIAQVQQKAQAKYQAQVEAFKLQQQAESERELRTRFESQPNPEVIRATRTPKPAVSPITTTARTRPASIASEPEESPSPTKATVPLGRFAQARQTAGTPFGELTALLARRSAAEQGLEKGSIPKAPVNPSAPSADEGLDIDKPAESASALAAAAPSQDRLAARANLKTLGHGRPLVSPTPADSKDRVQSSPLPRPASKKAEPAPTRSVSHGQPMKPIRQPFGPPAPVNELGDRNFQSMARKAAGKGLGMLGRRGDGSGSTSPNV